MTPLAMREARERRGWSQSEAARQIGVRQSYLSMVEAGKRRPSPEVLSRLVAAYGATPSALPLRDDDAVIEPLSLPALLGALGYAPFVERASEGPAVNPARVLLSALSAGDLDEPTVKALPWIAVRYADLDWAWLIRQVKQRDLQNRLGFVVATARWVADFKGRADIASSLRHWEASLEPARLLREDTLCRDSMAPAERDAVRVARSPVAARWNILTTLSVETLGDFDWGIETQGGRPALQTRRD
jgi:transcriptional regulator with XRE-family HTH domain